MDLDVHVEGDNWGTLMSTQRQKYTLNYPRRDNNRLPRVLTDSQVQFINCHVVTFDQNHLIHITAVLSHSKRSNQSRLSPWMRSDFLPSWKRSVWHQKATHTHKHKRAWKEEANKDRRPTSRSFISEKQKHKNKEVNRSDKDPSQLPVSNTRARPA